MRRLRDAAEEMREQLSLTSKAVRCYLHGSVLQSLPITLCPAICVPASAVSNACYQSVAPWIYRIAMVSAGVNCLNPTHPHLLVAVAVQAEKLVGKLDQLGGTAGDLGLSLFKVAKFEVRTYTNQQETFTA